MQTFALISQKGGAGKSTLSRQLAVIAGETGPSFLVDRDPQATTSRWWKRRQTAEAAEQPGLLDLGANSLGAAVERLRDKPGTLFVDTRPAVAEPEAEAARAADWVIVPVRPSPDDLEAVNDTLAMLRRIGKPALIVVNAARNRERAEKAMAALARWPVAVCPQHLTDRTVYYDAALLGLGTTEMQGVAAQQAATELRAVWRWIQEAGQ